MMNSEFKVENELLRVDTPNTIANKQKIHKAICGFLAQWENLSFTPRRVKTDGDWSLISFFYHYEKEFTSKNLIPLNETYFTESGKYKHSILCRKNGGSIIPMIIKQNRELIELDPRRNHIHVFIDCYKKYVLHGINPIEKLRTNKTKSTEIVNKYNNFKYNITIFDSGKIQCEVTKSINETKDDVTVITDKFTYLNNSFNSQVQKNSINVFNFSKQNYTDFGQGCTYHSTNDETEFKKIMESVIKEQINNSLSQSLANFFCII